jgi:hypothetical protein
VASFFIKLLLAALCIAWWRRRSTKPVPARIAFSDYYRASSPRQIYHPSGTVYLLKLMSGNEAGEKLLSTSQNGLEYQLEI